MLTTQSMIKDENKTKLIKYCEQSIEITSTVDRLFFSTVGENYDLSFLVSNVIQFTMHNAHNPYDLMSYL